MKKRWIALFLTLVMLLGMVPTGAAAETDNVPVGTVRVMVENNTALPAPNGGYGTWATDADQWYGTQIDQTVNLYANSTMLTCIAAGLEGHTSTGVDAGYITEIDGLKAGDWSTGSMAGWMGTLNDWFTSEGFAAYTYANGKLRDGDVIRLVYSLNYGVDVGSDYTSTDKQLTALTAEGATLSPAFSASVTDYELVLGDAESAQITLDATAKNKNFLVVAFQGDVTAEAAAALTENSWYTAENIVRFGQSITVEPDDVITVVVGAPNWPSMCNGEYGCGAEDVAPAIYRIRAVNEASDTNAAFNAFFTALDGIATVENDAQYPMQPDSTENALVSTNAGVSSSNAGITLTFLQAAALQFSYKASSESRWDYLKVVRIANGAETALNDSDKASFSGAMSDYVTYTVEMQAGEKLRLTYYKDGSGNKNSDCVWLKDFTATLPHQVVFHANDGTDTTATQGVFGSAALNGNTFVREGYRFEGWATQADGAVVYEDGAQITLDGADVDLYAVWTKIWRVSFPNMPEGTALTVRQGETELPASDTVGVWLLPDGSYTYSASLFGYLAVQDVPFTVSGADLAVADTLTASPKMTVTFALDGLREGDTATITVYNPEGTLMEPTSDAAVYALPAAEYTYTITAKGYKTLRGSLTVGTEAANVPITMTALSAWDGTVGTAFAGGSGTAAAPYEIESGEELAYLSQTVANGTASSSTYYVLTADIDMGGVAFTPIGADSSHTFSGHFDGAGHTISNLTVATEGSNAALFGRSSGTITDVTLDHASITGGNMYTGALVGYLSGSVSGCAVKNSTVTGSGDYTGGLIGMAAAKVERCAALDTRVGGTSHVGGVIGKTSQSVEKCYAARITVTASGDYAGGVIGSTDKTYYTMANLFARGTVSAANYAGGILGGYASAYSYSNATLKYVYAVVDVSAPSGTVGALAAKSVNVSALISFYCADSVIDGATVTAGGTAKTLDELKGEEVLAALGSEFAIYAQDGEFINGGLPYLVNAPANEIVRPTALSATSVAWSGKTASWTAVENAKGYEVTLTKDGEPLSTETLEVLTRDFSALIDLNGSGEYTVTVTALGDGEHYGSSAAASAAATFTVVSGNVVFRVTRADGLAFEAGRMPEIRLTMADGETTLTLENNVERALPLGSYTYSVSAKTFVTQSGEFTLTEAGTEIALALEYSRAWDGETTAEPQQLDGVYQISNGYELAWFRDAVNRATAESYALSAVLTDDIDLGGHDWTPISAVVSTSALNGYIGTFDGCGKTITNLKPVGTEITSYSSTEMTGAGLFGYVYTGGTVKNVTVEGSMAAVKYSGGVVAILAGGTVENCVNRMAITLDPDTTNGYSIGGVVGYMTNYTDKSSYVVDCRNEGDVLLGANGRYAGGVVGNASSGTEIARCENTGAVSSGERTGGVVGSASLPLTACRNTGAVYATKASVGGIAGFANKVVKNCDNSGSVIGALGKVGGIVGELNSSAYGALLTGCLNTGDVSSEDETVATVGALVGTKANNDTAMTVESSYYLSGTCTKAIGANASELDKAASVTQTELESKTLIGRLGGAFASLDGTARPVLNWQDENAKSVVVFDIPEGATVTVEGQTAAAGEPNAFVLDDGTYSYTVAKTDYNTASNTITVDGESLCVAVELTLVTYAVTFDVQPDGATVTVTDVNGTVWTADDDGVYDLPRGEYRYTVSKFGFVAVEGSFTVTDSNVSIPQITLADAEFYSVELTYCDESGEAVTPATVTVTAADGTTVPVEEDGSYRLPDGVYTCTVEDERYYIVSRSFTVNGAALSLQITLEENRAWDGVTLTAVTPNSDGIYEIGSAAELAWFAAQVNSGNTDYNAKLTANIYVNYNGSTNTWTPIGSYSKQYVGTFDGNGKSINGLDNTLFGYNGAGSLVKALTVRGSVSGESNVGGICNASYGAFEGCVNEMTVTASGQRAGGIVGLLYAGGHITDCANFGSITSSNASEWSNGSYRYAYLGGIVGLSYAPVSRCVNAGAVTATSDSYGSSNVGGIAGEMNGAALTECYNVGTVSSAHSGGGIVGSATGSDAVITDSYSVGTIRIIGDAVNPQSGAVAGTLLNSATLNNCYFLKGAYTYSKGLTSHDDEAVGYTATEGAWSAECKLATEMKLASFAIALSPVSGSFHMDTDGINNGYPVLAWQGGSVPVLSQDELDVAADKAALTVQPSVVTTTDPIVLATVGQNGSTITWESSRPEIISAAGAVTLPADNEATVVLTATITKGIVTDTKTFTLTVITQAAAEQSALDAAKAQLGTSFRVDYREGTVNVTDIVAEKLTANGVLTAEDITVSLVGAGTVSYGSGTLIDETGNVTYYYDDPANAINGDAVVNGVTFKLTAPSGVSVTTDACTVAVAWDRARVTAELQTAADTLSFDSVRGENTDADAVRTDLTLPQRLADYGWTLIRWDSSDNTVIAVTGGEVLSDFVGSVTPAEEDTRVTLTATFVFNKNNTEKDGEITVEKTIEVTVRGMANDYMDTIRAALDQFTLESLTYSTGAHAGEVIDPDAVTDNIQLPIGRTLGINADRDGYLLEYSASTEGDATCPITVNGYRANVIRPIAEQGTQVKLTLTVTKRNNGVVDERYTDSKTLTLTVAPLKPSEIAAELALLEQVEQNFFAGINAGANVAPNAVTTDLRAFAEAYLDADGALTWVYDAAQMTDSGIVPTALDGYDPMVNNGWRAFRSSDPSVITHENMLVTCPESEDATVTITANLKSVRFGEYYEMYRDDAEYGPIFRRLAGEEVEVTLTVISVAHQAEAAAVAEMIAAIGEVTQDSGDAIAAARAAYDALSAGQKLLVSNVDTLIAAEEAYAALPTEPSVEPTEPSVEPTEPSVEPTEPSVEPTEPSVEPTEPSVEPTEPSVEPTEPSVEPTEPIEEHTHSYTAVVTAPTCTEQGYTTYTCSCGKSYVSNYTEMVDHDYVAEVTVKPTATTAGEKTYTCSVCGKSYTEVIPTTGVEPTEPPVEPEEPCDGGKDCPGHSFSDMPKASDWAHEGIDYAVKNGLMNGMGNNKFEPETAMTRAMLVTVLWRNAGSPKEGKNTFTDVKNGEWYTDAIAWAAANGIVNGMGNNTFEPDTEITREQMATILYRYANLLKIDTTARAELKSFKDASDVNDWAKEAVQWAVASGVITGSKEPDGTYLFPQNPATRAQVATMLMRYLKTVIG